MKAKMDLLRVIKTPEDKVMLDPGGKKHGRGAYLCFSLDCLRKARRSKALERSLNITIPEEICEGLEQEMKEIDNER